jgi:phage antirepressor YoqD-like protein
MERPKPCRRLMIGGRMSHADVPENAATLEEQVALVFAYMRSEAAATMRELYAELRVDEDFVERACIQKACRGLSSTQISAIQARIREGEEVPARSVFTIEAWERVSARERGEFREAEEEAMNDRAAEKTMTVREVAEQLGCNPETVKGHIRELFPGLMENGKATYLTETQVTVILEKMKMPVSSGAKSNLQFEIVGIDTMKSRALRIEMLHRQIETEMEAEIAELRAEKEAMKPKAEYHDRLVDAALTTSFRDTAKELGVPERQFIETLIRKGYIYRDAHGNLKPYHNRMAYFTVKDWERGGSAGTQTRVTVALGVLSRISRCFRNQSFFGRQGRFPVGLIPRWSAGSRGLLSCRFRVQLPAYSGGRFQMIAFFRHGVLADGVQLASLPSMSL